MRTRDWYFQGWERGPDGSFRYTGEYYTLPAGKPKTVTLCLGGALCAVYLLTALLPSEGGMWRIAAVPQLLEIIPLIYLVIGAVCLLRADDPMTFRDWYASWRRMKSSAAWSLVFSAAMTLAELAFLFAAKGYRLGPELLYHARVLCCAALSFCLHRFLHMHPCAQSVSEQGADRNV